MENKVLITIDSVNIPQMEREAEEKKKYIIKMEEFLTLLWSITPFDFKKAIDLMETASFLGYKETAELIEYDLKEWYPASWEQYQASLKSDASCADGDTDAR